MLELRAVYGFPNFQYRRKFPTSRVPHAGKTLKRVLESDYQHVNSRNPGKIFLGQRETTLNKAGKE
jgi:hypothetical protein